MQLLGANSSTGVLGFIATPDFETPTDVGADNVYDVTVQVSDGVGGIDTQGLAPRARIRGFQSLSGPAPPIRR